MSQVPSAATPILFEPAMEQPEADEANTISGLDETLAGIRETTYRNSGHAFRSVHAKAHGILRGTFVVLDGLPPHLAQGLFAKAGSYPVVMRFSTIPGDILNDSISTPRGVALKVTSVEGERLPGSEHDSTQDFVLVNGPAFGASTAQKFLGSLKTVAATTDKYAGLKEVASRVARVTEAIIEAFGGKSALVVTLGGQPATHILGETFYSQTPFLFGPYICKFSLAPASANLVALTGTHIALNGTPNALRESVNAHFEREGGEWDLRVQLNTGLSSMPIENSSIPWPEDQSPYVAVARVSAPPQDAWSAENVATVDDCLSFSPWHGLAAHRPLGSVNRVRQTTYRNSAGFRGMHNGCPVHDPKIE